MSHPLDHLGIAVVDLSASIAFYERTFGFRVDSRETVESQGVELAFVKLDNTLIELLMPTRADSTLAKFLQKRGPGLHHVCYRVPDIRAEMQRLKGLGIEFIHEFPRPGAHHSLIAFMHPKSTGGVLTELCERAI
jgi:methylmalonyl-CoA epimerase